MKKLFILFILTFTTLFAFAEHTLNFSIIGASGSIPHNIDNEKYDGSKSYLGLSSEYVYFMKNGFSFGGNFTFYPVQTFSISPNESTIIELKRNSLGDGFSFSPVVGWTYKREVFYLQLLAHPIIIESITYDTHNITIGNTKSKNIYKDITSNYLKTGVSSSFEWGWKHYRLGFGVGLNVIFDYDFNEERQSESGTEVYACAKTSVLF